MISDRIIGLARDFNPWWEGGNVEVPDYKRHAYNEILRYMERKQIIAIVGLRRTGKTVLMKQMIKEFQDGKNAFYFLFDDLMAQNPEVLEDVINYYLKSVAGNGRKYIFLDEIQKVPNWQDIVKRFYDTRSDIKFAVSGSASLQIRSSKESLAGRIFDFHLPVLTFREFLEMNGLSIDKAGMNYESLRKVYELHIHKKPLIEKLFLEYILRGGFPEIATEEDEPVIKKYVSSSVTERIVFEDIPNVFGAEKRDVLFSLLEYCSRETANIFDVTNIAKSLGVNYETVKSYLFYLQYSFIIDIVYNHSKSTLKQLRKNKKIHIAHPSIAVSLLGYGKDSILPDEIRGRYIETIVFSHMKLVSKSVSFWRTPQKDEVDIILSGANIVPIEVKYKTSLNEGDSKSIRKFMEIFKAEKGLIATKDILEKKLYGKKEIIYVPAWLLLLVV